MSISIELLIKYGAKYDYFELGEIVFREGTTPKYYFQIVKGIVEMNNYAADGKEFTHDILSDGDSIGTSLLFSDKMYPINAVTKTKCEILKIPKSDFLIILYQNSDITFTLLTCLSERLYYKYLMLYNLSSNSSFMKIKTLLDYFKTNNSNHNPYSFKVNLTRQQLAYLTGLRTETVIRIVKKMEKEKILMIKNGKIFY